MLIIDHTKPSAPIWEYTPVPVFKTTVEKQRYWDKQNKLWVEGYADIPGTLIFKTQECVCKHRITGQPFRPQARYADLMIHQFIDQQRKRKAKSANIIKPRGIGLSTDFGCLSNYFMRVFPGSTSLITSKDQKGIGTLFSEKIKYTYEKLHPDIRPLLINKNETRDKCFLKTAILLENDNIAESRVLCSETSEKPKSPTNFSGEGAIAGMYDEFPLHPRKQELLKSSSECYRDPATGEMVGILIAGGTVEDTLSGNDFNEFAKYIHDLDPEDLLFLPFWMNKFVDANGYPDKEKAQIWWEQELETLTKKNDVEGIIAFKKNQPSCREDIFALAQNTFWEEDVDDKLRKHRDQIVLNCFPHKRGKLLEIGGQVSFEPIRSGTNFSMTDLHQPPVTIIEECKPNVEYYLLVDGTGTGLETGEKEGSFVAGVILKGYDPEGDSFGTPACYFERPRTVEASYINLINLASYYNKYNNFKGIEAEANIGTGDHFSTFLKNKGLWHWVIKRKDLSGKGYTNTSKPFQAVNDVVRDYQVRCANVFLRKYIQHIKLIPLLNSLILPKGENADLRDAWLMMFILFPNVDANTPKEKVKKAYRKPEYYKDSQGAVRIRWVTVHGDNTQTWNP